MAGEALSPIFNQPGIAGFTFMRAGEKFPPIEEGWQKKGHSFGETAAYQGNIGLMAGNGYGGIDQDDLTAFEGLVLPETTTWETRPGRLGMWLEWSDNVAEVLVKYGFNVDQAQVYLYDPKQITGIDKKGREIYKHIGEVKLERAYQVIPPSWKTVDGQRINYRMLKVIQPADVSLDWLLSELLRIGLRFNEKSKEAKYAASSAELEPKRVQAIHRIGDTKAKAREFLQQALSEGLPGNRNKTGFWLACQLRDLGMVVDEASEYLISYARGVPKGDHPYTEENAQCSLEQAYSQAPRDPPRSKTARREEGLSLADALLLASDLKKPDNLKANPGLPYEPRHIKALAVIYNGNRAEYERIIATIKKAKISTRDLSKRVKQEREKEKPETKEAAYKDKEQPRAEKVLSLDDIAIPTEEDIGDGKKVKKWEFSPTLAARSVTKKIPLAMTEGEDKRIWRYDGQIYRDNGRPYVTTALYEAGMDKIHPSNVSEVFDRVGAKLQLSPVNFNPIPHLLGTKNGVLDCKTQEFRPYHSEDLINDMVPVEHVPVARCPEILKFIETITPNIDDRITLIDIIASGAYRKDLAYIAFLLGHGSSGSSTYVQLTQAFYGSKTTEAVPLKELLDSRFALSALKDARFSFGEEIDEVNETGTSTIKRISGGDWISADQKNKDRARFRGWTKLVFTTNKIPRFTDDTFAFVRRFTEVTLPYKFVDAVDPKEPNQRQKDPDLIDKITTPSELSGLLNLVAVRLPWIIKHRRIYKRAGHYTAYKEQTDSVITFLERFCTFYPEAPSAKVSTKKMYGYFERWADLTLGNQVNDKWFGRYVRKYCDSKPPKETTIDGESCTVYPGLSFDEEKCKEEIGELESRLTGLKPDETGSKDSLYLSNTGSTGLKSLIDPKKDVTPSELWDEIKRLFGEEYNAQNQDFDPVFDEQRPKLDPVPDPVINPVSVDGGSAAINPVDPVDPVILNESQTIKEECATPASKEADKNSKEACVICGYPIGPGYGTYDDRYCASCGPKLPMVKASAKAMVSNGNRPTTGQILEDLSKRGRPPLKKYLHAMLREIGLIEEGGIWKNPDIESPGKPKVEA